MVMKMMRPVHAGAVWPAYRHGQLQRLMEAVTLISNLGVKLRPPAQIFRFRVASIFFEDVVSVANKSSNSAPK